MTLSSGRPGLVRWVETTPERTYSGASTAGSTSDRLPYSTEGSAGAHAQFARRQGSPPYAHAPVPALSRDAVVQRRVVHQ
jgi:hypothetical protein